MGIKWIHVIQNMDILYKMTFRSSILFLALTMATFTAWGKPTPLPFFSANYDASIHGFSVTATREYKPINENLAELNFSATSLIANLTETSQFTWEEDQIKPIRFTHERNLIGKEQKKILTFDWPNKKIISTNKDKTYIIPDTEKVLDRLSFQLQLQHDLLLAKDSYIYRIADKNRIKEYSFEIMGNEVISTELGKLDTTKVKVVRAKKKRVTYIWLARDWQHLLARLEQYKGDEKEFSIQITSATMDGKTVLGL